MAAISWKTGISGSWTLGSDWDSGTVPGSGDDATIGIAGTYTVTLTASISVNSITISDPQATLAIANPGGSEVVVGDFNNAGKLNLDSNSSAGGSSLSIGATLSNSGVVSIGNTGLAAATTVTATGLVNSGTINLTGSGNAQAIFNITGAGTNSGDLELRGHAAVRITSGGLINSGKANIDTSSGEGGSSLSIGGTLSNSTTIGIGNANLGAGRDGDCVGAQQHRKN